MAAEYETKFRKHAVHGELAQLSEFLDEFGEESDKKATAVLERVRRAASYTKGRIDIADPALTPISALDAINKQIPNVKGQLNNFKSNRNAGHLDQATTHLDAILAANAQLVVPLGDDAEENLISLTSRFRERGEETIRQTEEKIDSYATRINEIEAGIKTNKSELSELAGSVQSEKERVDGVVAEFQKTSQEREDNRTNQFNEALKGYNQQVTAVEKDFENRGTGLETQLKQKIEQHEKGFTRETDRILADLEKSKQAASDLVHVVGNIGVTGNYQQTANDDKEAADRFRRGAVACFLAMAGIIVVTAFQINSIGWDGVLFRLGAAIIFAFPGAYMALESSKHREAANRNRRVELELASLEPFIEKLPDDKKAELKAELTAKYFGQKDEPPVSKDVLPTAGLVEVLKTLGKWSGDK